MIVESNKGFVKNAIYNSFCPDLSSRRISDFLYIFYHVRQTG